MIVKLDATKDSTEYVKIIFELVPIAQKVASDMESYAIPEPEKEIFANVISQHRLQANAFTDAANLLRSQDPNTQKKLNAIMETFFTNMEGLRTSNVGEIYVTNSPIAADFQEALRLEKKIFEFINTLENAEEQEVNATPTITQTISQPDVTPTPKDNPGKGKDKDK